MAEREQHRWIDGGHFAKQFVTRGNGLVAERDDLVPLMLPMGDGLLMAKKA